jgi:peptidoglycan/xylan/chitin deacetylase (PgdA/CDA1 family)
MRKKRVSTSILFVVAWLSWGQAIKKTEIMPWQLGKKAAVSLTYDDGSINQFTQALPIMNRLRIPATFYIVTGHIPGSQYEGKFIGRPVDQIIRETESTATDATNFFERASAVAFLGYQGTLEYHTKAGAAIDAGRAAEAYAIIDDVYRRVRAGEFFRKSDQDNRKGVTWDEIRQYAKQGHEFGSHTVTHPYLAALDETNILYELKRARRKSSINLANVIRFLQSALMGPRTNA